MTSTPSRSCELRAADKQRSTHVQLPRARHELRRDDDPVAYTGVGGEKAADDALALAASVDLGGVEKDHARRNARLPSLSDARLRQALVVSAHAPGPLVAPGPGADAKRRDGNVRAGELDQIARPWAARRRSRRRWATQARCASTAAAHCDA